MDDKIEGLALGTSNLFSQESEIYSFAQLGTSIDDVLLYKNLNKIILLLKQIPTTQFHFDNNMRDFYPSCAVI